MLDSRYMSTYGASYRPRLHWSQGSCPSDHVDVGKVRIRQHGNYGEDGKNGRQHKEAQNYGIQNFAVEPRPPRESRTMEWERPIGARKRTLRIAKSDHLKGVMDKNMSTNAALLSDSLIFDTKFGPMDMHTMNALEHKYRYTSSTKRANQEYGFPMVRPEPQKYRPLQTLEPKPDMVRLKGQRYEETRSEWQDADLFDRYQSRYLLSPPKTQKSPEILQMKRKPLRLELDDERKARIRDLVNKDSLANVFVRQIPGYAGYMPLCPPETDLEKKHVPKNMLSLVRGCYRYHPETQHAPYEQARTGVLSKLVTLTYPFNPFNKVEKEDIMETLGKRNL